LERELRDLRRTHEILEEAASERYVRQAELEEYFLACVDEARKDASRRRYSGYGLKQTSPRSTRQDVLDSLVSSEEDHQLPVLGCAERWTPFTPEAHSLAWGRYEDDLHAASVSAVCSSGSVWHLNRRPNTSTKMFVNICGHPLVEGPLLPSGARADGHLVDKMGIRNMQVPVDVGSFRRVFDRAGNACVAIDVIFAPWLVSKLADCVPIIQRGEKMDTTRQSLVVDLVTVALRN
ncbi:hypothetical protein FOZ63_006854, partial [Perkinsus olseni]